MANEPSISEMAGVTIMYKGEDIAKMISSGAKTLQTSGKYCEDDIQVVYDNPELPTQSKTVTPTANGFTVSPDSGKVLSSVVVNGDADLVPANVRNGVNIFGVTGTMHEGITPSGTKNITTNGTYDVTNFSNASVNVPNVEARSKTWDLNTREERRLNGGANGTFYFNAAANADFATWLPTDDRCWINACRHINGAVVYNNNDNTDWVASTLSSVTASGCTLKTGSQTELFIAIPYHLMAGETFSITYTKSASNRGGYILCDKHGRYLSQELISNRQISRRMDTHGIIVVERFATFRYY